MLESSLTPRFVEAHSWNGRFRRYDSIGRRLAWRNFTRDRVRLVISVVGVGFAVLLATLQLGLLIGFARTSSSLVDHAKADFWVVPRGAKDVDQAGLMVERQKFAALGMREVAACRARQIDRKSTRLNSSHVEISYAVF